jgi:hypothetical protein
VYRVSSEFFSATAAKGLEIQITPALLLKLYTITSSHHRTLLIRTQYRFVTTSGTFNCYHPER